MAQILQKLFRAAPHKAARDYATIEPSNELERPPRDLNSIDWDEDLDGEEQDEDRGDEASSDLRVGTDFDPLTAEPASTASFSVRNPFQGVDVPTLVAASLVAAGALLARWLVKRLRRPRKRSSARAFAWRSAHVDAPPRTADVSRPLAGVTFAVSENRVLQHAKQQHLSGRGGCSIPTEGRRPQLQGAPQQDAGGSHTVVTALLEHGATLTGAASVDPLAISGPAVCRSTRGISNALHPSRVVLGSNGALAALVAAGEVTLGVGLDSGADVAVAAACAGVLAFRCSHGAVSGDDDDQPLLPSTTCTAPVLLSRDASILGKLGRALKLPGSAQAVDELRLLLAADLFILTDDVAVEKVSNGVVTRAVKSWIADSERLRQVELLPWVAKQLDAWDAFAPKPRGSPDSKQVMLAIEDAHATILAWESRNAVEEWGAQGLTSEGPARATMDRAQAMEESDYNAAVALRDALSKIMQDALTSSSVMLMPLLAGAAPHATGKSGGLNEAGQKIADLTMSFAAFVAMSGCPAAVLPVPPVTEGGAPWAVMLVGRHRCDAQLLQLAGRLSSHVQRTAETVAQEIEDSKAKKSPAAKKAEATAAERATEAEELRQRGNQAFKDGDYVGSHELYSSAIQLVSDRERAVLYSNRAMAYLKLDQPELAAADCLRSLKLAWSSKAAYRHGVAAMALGRHDKALESFQAVLAHEPKNKAAQDKVEECEELLGDGVGGEEAVADEEAMLA